MQKKLPRASSPCSEGVAIRNPSRLESQVKLGSFALRHVKKRLGMSRAEDGPRIRKQAVSLLRHSRPWNPPLGVEERLDGRVLSAWNATGLACLARLTNIVSQLPKRPRECKLSIRCARGPKSLRSFQRPAASSDPLPTKSPWAEISAWLGLAVRFQECFAPPLGDQTEPPPHWHLARFRFMKPWIRGPQESKYAHCHA